MEPQPAQRKPDTDDNKPDTSGGGGRRPGGGGGGGVGANTWRSHRVALSLILGQAFLAFLAVWLFLAGFAQIGFFSSLFIAKVAGLGWFAMKVAQWVHVVPPGLRKIIMTLDGDAIVLRPGISVASTAPCVSVFETHGCWRGLGISRGMWPAPGARITIDPEPTQINSSEGVTGTVDVTVECVVSDWEASSLEDLVSDTGSIKARTQALVNQWVCQRLGELSARELTYGRTSATLNVDEALAELNEKLERETHLTCYRVLVDSGGVSLNHRYMSENEKIQVKAQIQRAEETRLERERALERQRQDAEAAKNEFEREQRRLAAAAAAEAEIARAESELAVARLELEGRREREAADVELLTNLIAGGLEPAQVAAMKIAESHAASLAAAKLVVASPGSFGIGGVQGMLGSVGVGVGELEKGSGSEASYQMT